MTALIVALDNPGPQRTAFLLYWKADIRWFKIGPQAMTCQYFWGFIGKSDMHDWKIFADFKLADTWDTCKVTAQRLAEAGVLALSTFTDRATEAAMRGAEGSQLRVWRVARLTDYPDMEWPASIDAHGIICPVSDLGRVASNKTIDKVCPGIRQSNTEAHGHKLAARPEDAANAGATHIVVGRPIWEANDPAAVARAYAAALSPPNVK